MIRRHPLLTPRQHLDVLIHPPDAAWSRWLTTGVERGGGRILDADVASVRQSLRSELSISGTLILTGHQLEFFHAGVFAKNLAAGLLAQVYGATATFLAVDSDVVKHERLTLPRIRGARAEQTQIAIPGFVRDRPSERLQAAPLAAWRTFFEGVRAALATRGPQVAADSLLPIFEEAFLERVHAGAAFVDAMNWAIEASSTALGLPPLRTLRVSALCQTQAFRAFVAHLLLNAHAAAGEYNAALEAFRVRFGIRGQQRPVPTLQVSEELVELPFWLLGPDHARHRLMVQRQADELRLLADETCVAVLPAAELTPLRRHAQPWPSERDGWHIRPRALALSGFTRLLLADVFIHGVGGAEYDQITERWLPRVFGSPLAPMACVSACLLLPLPRPTSDVLPRAEALRMARELRWNPERHAPLPAAFADAKRALITESARLRESRPADRRDRRRVFQEIRALNDAAAAALSGRIQALQVSLESQRDLQEQQRVALDREYFYALHPRSAAEALRDRLRDALL